MLKHKSLKIFCGELQVAKVTAVIPKLFYTAYTTQEMKSMAKQLGLNT